MRIKMIPETIILIVVGVIAVGLCVQAGYNHSVLLPSAAATMAFTGAVLSMRFERR